MKTYQVYYWIKANRTEKLYVTPITAANAKEACGKCKAEVKEKTGRNAFRPTIKCPEGFNPENERSGKNVEN